MSGLNDQTSLQKHDHIDDTTYQALTLAEALPDLRIKASHLARTLQAGWHGRKKAGTGETFWQFRQLAPGDSAQSIDWRKSARDDHLYRRENEWEATQTIRFLIDLSPSMDFGSHLALQSKRDTALIVSLALAETLLQQGERLALLNDPLEADRLYSGAYGFENFTQALMRTQNADLRAYGHLRHGDSVLVMSDFLNTTEAGSPLWQSLTGQNRSVFAVHVIDPAEHAFPYSGRVLFEDPETRQTYLSSQSEMIKQDYQTVFQAHCENVLQQARHYGAMLLAHHNDRPLSDLAMRLCYGLSEHRL
jgi:uncharacterized protein (DUF58 family)